MTPERLAIIKQSLGRRQTDLTVVMENVGKPHNLANNRAQTTFFCSEQLIEEISTI